ncbi:MAG: RDD family protein [Acidobacteriota bacterium]|nr:RDD family protein [Acidobacteriota bacterium]
MRCSKCQYISFDNGDRCRNCGYEFSLSVDEDVLDLPIRTEEPSGPLADLSLADLDAPIAAPMPPVRSVPTPQPANPRREQTTGAPASGELPLFRSGSRDDDAPLVKLPAVPRVPVSVRKSTAIQRPPEPQRPVFEEFELDLAPEDDYDDAEGTDEQVEEDDDAPVQRAAPVRRTASTHAAVSAELAPIVPRILAAVIDLGLIVGMDAIVLRLTLRICGLQFADAAAIPVVPFAAFLVLLNGGYVAAFTAVGGQTIGKMLTGIRVVTSEEDAWTDRVPVGPSALRALGYLLSALPAGLGFLPVLIGSDRRGVHDRLAHTRVVKA